MLNISYKNSLVKSELKQVTTVSTGITENISTFGNNTIDFLYTLSSSYFLKDILLELEEGFKKVNQLNLSKEEKNKLILMYENEFLPRVKNESMSFYKKRASNKFLPKSNSGQQIQSYFLQENRELENYDYFKSYKNYDKYFSNLIDRSEYYDIFIISKEGDIIYTYFKEIDLGTNLLNGVFDDSELARVFREARELKADKVAFTDFKPYEPSYNKLEGFVGIPVYKEDEFLGVLAVQVSLKNFEKTYNYIYNTENKNILGDEGELYLVGSDGYMKTQSRFIDIIKNPLAKRYNTTINAMSMSDELLNFINDQHEDEDLFRHINYRGIEVLTSIRRINFLGEIFFLVMDLDINSIIEESDKTVSKIVAMTSFLLVGLTIFSLVGFQKNILRPLEKVNSYLTSDVTNLNNELIEGLALLEEYKKALDTSSIVSKISVMGKYIYVNNNFMEITGYHMNELYNTNFQKRFLKTYEKSIENYKSAWNRINKKEIWRGEFASIKKNGEVYYTKATIVPILDRKGEIKEFMVLEENITELERKRRIIEGQFIDKLTNLGNRFKFLKEIDSNKTKQVSIININEFHLINDYYGNDVGDRVIVLFSKELVKRFSKYGFEVYRISGDEFAILNLKNDITKEIFRSYCEKEAKLLTTKIHKIDGNDLHIKVNFGLSEGSDKSVLAKAHMALAKAKENKTRSEVYAEEMLEDNSKKIFETKIIKEALKNDKLLVYAQPIVNSSSGKVKKYECLVRLELPSGKVLSPCFFLETSKKIGLYTYITDVVIHKAFEYFKGTGIEFSINLTADDMSDEVFAVKLVEKIKKYGVEDQLTIEIIETEEIEGNKIVKAFIQTMKELGIKLAIDDFGTGYSNFSYFMSLDADYVKIDGSLINKITSDKLSLDIVNVITDISKRLDIEVIAEFVSDEKIFETVRELGINYSQGYYISKPKELGKEYKL